VDGKRLTFGLRPHQVANRLAFIGVVVFGAVRYCDYPDLTRGDGRCIGITDGSDGPVFGAGTAEALRAIGAENARLDANSDGRQVVSLAYVMPLPPPGKDDAYAARGRVGGRLPQGAHQASADRAEHRPEGPLRAKPWQGVPGRVLRRGHTIVTPIEAYDASRDGAANAMQGIKVSTDNDRR
jgi:hypothetical protein